MLLKKHKLCLPGTLRGRAIALAHKGHLGITKTKLLRSKVWFPGIDLRVEEAIKHCIPCQAVTRVNTREPVLMTPFPNGPWISISIDFYGLPTGEEAMVVTDDYSRYPELAEIKSTAAKFVCPILDAIFARHGLPDIIRSDNGPPFNGKEFGDFAANLGITHRRVAPLWPNANLDKWNVS